MSSHIVNDEVQQHHDNHHQVDRADAIRIVAVGIVVLLSILKVPQWYWLAVAGTVLGGLPIFEEAWENLRERRMTMELSMSIALLAALAISEAFTALVITLFVLIAEVLEKLTMKRGRNAIQHLLSLMPQEAFIRNGEAVQSRKATEIALGEIVVIRPGARVPVDGTVVTGHSFIDQAPITGESVPSEKVAGSVVYAGTINQTGTLDVVATGTGMDTAFGRIIHAVEMSEQHQAPIQKTADRLAGYLVYFAIGCALLTFLLTHNVKSTISVVIVAGACGIAAGTPLAILGGVGRAARNGSIIKGGLYLELLSAIDTVVFDKTGTLTYGQPKVMLVSPVAGISDSELLRIAATAESVSEHPLGQAIVAEAKQRAIIPGRVEKFAYEPGRGISCEVDGSAVLVGNRSLVRQHGIDIAGLEQPHDAITEVVIAQSGQLLGTISIADELRAEAKQAVQELQSMGIKPILLTGDTKSIAQAIGRQLAIDEVAAEVLPDEKQGYIKKLNDSGRRVAMVGDGINDAAALIEASVGVAVGSGTDVARESADIVLIGNDLRRFVDTVKIARRCQRIIMTNFVGTLLVDGFGVLLAAFGFLNPLLAAFIHVSSELIFILNSARLLPAKGRQ